jgi:hypothetical protein
MHYANVFPNILFAITLLPNPVYPGIGFYNFTYYFPSTFMTFEFPSYLFFYYAIFCLNAYVFDKEN